MNIIYILYTVYTLFPCVVQEHGITLFKTTIKKIQNLFLIPKILFGVFKIYILCFSSQVIQFNCSYGCVYIHIWNMDLETNWMYHTHTPRAADECLLRKLKRDIPISTFIFILCCVYFVFFLETLNTYNSMSTPRTVQT